MRTLLSRLRARHEIKANIFSTTDCHNALSLTSAKRPWEVNLHSYGKVGRELLCENIIAANKCRDDKEIKFQRKSIELSLATFCRKALFTLFNWKPLIPQSVVYLLFS